MTASPDPAAPIALVGAGTIGVGWAIVFAMAGRHVRLSDPVPERLAAALRDIDARLADLAAYGLLDEPEAAIAGRVAAIGELGEALAGARHVQENAPESLDLKRTLFTTLDRLAAPEAIIASSSSALTASSFAGDLPGRGRCLVVHPANPPFLLRIAEVVPAPFTHPEVVEATAALMASVGQRPVVVRHEPEGFVFNRLQGAVLREAYALVRDGVIGVEELDLLVRDGLGFRWSVTGPFETSDLNVRGGIAAHAERMAAAYARMGAERGQNDPWTPDLVARVAAERRALLPLDRWGERAEWRDRRLMALARERRAARSSET